MHNTIRIVDDDESMRTFLSTLLQGAGNGVVVADGVKAGMKVLEQPSVDLLIADVRLGVANGLQLIAMSRQSMPSIAISMPSIAITGIADPVIGAQARQFGAMFLLKPFTSASLSLDTCRGCATGSARRSAGPSSSRRTDCHHRC